MNGKFWTVEELEIIHKHYPDNLTSEIMHLLPGRTVTAINSAANVYGYKKSKIFHAKGFGGRIAKGTHNGVSTEFKKGNVSHNKGRKQIEWMCAENIEKSKKGCFKKGNVSHNTLPIGSERITRDGYIEIKVRHSNDLQHRFNYELKHRILWEQHHGPIPKGMIVAFKTADKLNFTIEQLELITKRENVIRNGSCDTSIVKRCLGVKDPAAIQKIISEIPGLIQLKRTNIKLNSKIKSNENNN